VKEDGTIFLRNVSTYLPFCSLSYDETQQSTVIPCLCLFCTVVHTLSSVCTSEKVMFILVILHVHYSLRKLVWVVPVWDVTRGLHETDAKELRTTPPPRSSSLVTDKSFPVRCTAISRNHIKGDVPEPCTMPTNCILIFPFHFTERSLFVRFEVFTAVTMKNGVFLDVTPCGSCKNRRLGGSQRLLHQGVKNRWTRNNARFN
jgi:hypothetical protein